jgi:hypothetical protein
MNPYGSPAPAPPGSGLPTSVPAVISLILGIISILCMFTCCCSIFGLIGTGAGTAMGIVAAVLGNMGIKQARTGNYNPSSEGLGRAGMICGIVGAALCGILFMLWILAMVGFVTAPAWAPQPPGGTGSPFDSIEPYEVPDDSDPFGSSGFDSDPSSTDPFGTGSSTDPSSTDPFGTGSSTTDPSSTDPFGTTPPGTTP